jgi:hypothetical protein
MSSDTKVVHELFSNPPVILYFALVLLALFLGLLIFDPFRGGMPRHHGRHSHSQRPRPTFRQRLLMPFVQIRAIWVLLTDLARRRARRRARAERLAEQMRRYSK